MHEEFPRKFLESASCGDGFWETDGKGHYTHKGIMLEVKVGEEVSTKSKHEESLNIIQNNKQRSHINLLKSYFCLFIL